MPNDASVWHRDVVEDNTTLICFVAFSGKWVFYLLVAGILCMYTVAIFVEN